MDNINLEAFLYEEIKNVMNSWEMEDDAYAISFFVYSNELYVYENLQNLTEFSVGYNTEKWTEGAGPYDEARWNFAYWSQNNTSIIELGNKTEDANENFKTLLKWYRQEAIDDPGKQNEECPIGCLLLTQAVAKVARRLQEEGYLISMFKKSMPIIIHDLEYCQYVIDATKLANPNHEAADFFKYIENEFCF